MLAIKGDPHGRTIQVDQLYCPTVEITDCLKYRLVNSIYEIDCTGGCPIAFYIPGITVRPNFGTSSTN